MKAALNASWKAWIEAEVAEGRNRNEAEEIAIILLLCKIFDMKPNEFGIQFWPGGKAIGSTHKTGMIMANMVLALICDRIEDPPSKNEAVTELLKSVVPADAYKPALVDAYTL